ncbi:MAG: glycosyltransferase [Lautropia sp.]
MSVVVAIALALLIASGNLFVWDRAHPPIDAIDFDGDIGGLAYSAYGRWDSPITGKRPSSESIARDIELLSGKTRRLRTYTSSEFPEVVELAEKHGVMLTAGVWLDARKDFVEAEIDAIERAVRSHTSIERVIVGNESILHALLPTDEIISRIREVRRRTRKPVSTAEPWHVWLRYPELVRSVDFITVHLLPYWEGLPVQEALDYSFERLAQLRKRYPSKKIVIGEIGWPSQGDRRYGARATPAHQAQFIREFLVRARQMKLDYYLMESVDQPWKIDNEGRVGPYWGILDAGREPKFALTGPVESDPNWRTKAAIASAGGAVLVFAFLLRFARLRFASRLAFAIALQAVVALVVWLVALPFDHYMRGVDWVFVGLLIPALAMMSLIFLVNAFEFAEIFWPGNLKRRFASRALPPDAVQPRVSIHLACCNEQPDMVIATIRSLENLDYRNFEVLVIDNNTKDPALWKPVEAYVAGLDERFRFFHLPSWPGFKAGALNFALTQTDPAAEIVGVVDADYKVVSRWLRDLVGHFADPKTAVVQAPQAHRGWRSHLFRQMMSYEYDGFFRIGMHHRNERNAIIQHGTMTLVRASALRGHGNWSEWCICEDAELGLRLMKAGLDTVYVDEVMGRGLTPDTFNAFKKQRRRWAEGAMQILKGHFRALFMPRADQVGRLSGGQRFHFVAGWLSWIGDALHLAFALAAMAWTIAMIAAPQWFSLPIMLFMLPLFVFFSGRTLMGPLLYLRRVRCSIGDVAGSALAGMALSHGIARGIWSGLLNRTSVFEITIKGTHRAVSSATRAVEPASQGSQPTAELPAPPTESLSTTLSTPPASATGTRTARARWAGWLTIRPPGGEWGGAREEGLLLIGLLTCAGAMAVWRKPEHIESLMWIAILVMQAIPYAAALVCAGLSALPARRIRVPAPRAPAASVPVPVPVPAPSWHPGHALPQGGLGAGIGSAAMIGTMHKRGDGMGA